jgi:uncharacterized protein DUF6152
MTTVRLLRSTVLALSIAGVTGTADAHHSFAAFDMTKEKTVSGIVQKVDWTNPHIWIYLDVEGQNGATERYAFEGMTPNFLPSGRSASGPYPHYFFRAALMSASMWSRYFLNAARPAALSRYSVRGVRPANVFSHST